MQGTSSLERAGCLNENWSPKEKIQELHAFSVGRFASKANVIKVIFCINILFLKFYYLKHLSYVLLTGTFAKKNHILMNKIIFDGKIWPQLRLYNNTYLKYPNTPYVLIGRSIHG